MVGTLGVRQTLVGLAEGVGVALVVVQAEAVGAVELGLADGVLAARVARARVHAVPVSAGLVVVALVIASTTSYMGRRGGNRDWGIKPFFLIFSFSFLRSMQAA